MGSASLARGGLLIAGWRWVLKLLMSVLTSAVGQRGLRIVGLRVREDCGLCAGCWRARIAELRIILWGRYSLGPTASPSWGFEFTVRSPLNRPRGHDDDPCDAHRVGHEVLADSHGQWKFRAQQLFPKIGTAFHPSTLFCKGSPGKAAFEDQMIQSQGRLPKDHRHPRRSTTD